MSTPEHREVAALLLSKARGDLHAAEALAADRSQADHVVGLHAQQAVEKSLKGVLAARGIEIPRTHDLTRLVELTAADELTDVDWLTPWAGAWRYDEVLEGLDRAGAIGVARSALAWAEQQLG